MIIQKTERLQIRQLHSEDAAFIIKLLNSPGWLKFIGDRNVKTLESGRQYILEGPAKSYQENGFGLFLVELLDSKTAIGLCGLIRRPELQEVDLGFALLPQFEGKGYAGEASLAVLAFAKNEVKLETIQAITLPRNKRSIQLLERLRFQNKGLIPFKKEEVLLFELKFQDA